MVRGRTHGTLICLRHVGYSQAFSQTYWTLLLRVITKLKVARFLDFTEVSEAGVAETFLFMINTPINTYFEGGVFVNEHV